jgi:hypothetical protein
VTFSLKPWAANARSAAELGSAPIAGWLADQITRPPGLILLWLLGLLNVFRLAIQLPPKFADFNHYYVSALALREGINPYVTRLDPMARSLGLDLGGINKASYPPTFLLCFEALTHLPPHAAYWTWIGLNVAALSAALYLLLAVEKPLDSRRASVFLALTLMYPPLYQEFYYGETQCLILLLAVLMMVCAERGLDVAAGLLLAIAGMLKVFPFVLAGYLACRRQWRALAWTAVGVALIGLVTLWRVGPVAWSFTEAIPFLTNRFWLSDPDNISINAVVSRIFWPQGDLPLPPAADAVRRAVIALAELGVLLVTARATVRRETESERRWQAFSLWMVAMIVLSPTAFPNYLIMLAVPFAALARTATRGGVPARAAGAALASYGLAFSHQPLTLFERVFDLSSTAMVDRVAKEYWVLVVLLAYLASYWNVTGDRAPISAAQR